MSVLIDNIGQLQYIILNWDEAKEEFTSNFGSIFTNFRCWQKKIKGEIWVFMFFIVA